MPENISHTWLLRPTFNPSPYSMNWERLQQADTCVRKLCLIYLGAESNRSRKMKQSQDKGTIQTTLSPAIPMDQPSASALGVMGERSVAQSIVGNLVDISDDYQPPYYPQYPDFGRFALEEQETARMPEPVPSLSAGERRRLSEEELAALLEVIRSYEPPEPPLPPIAMALNRRWSTMKQSMASLLDRKHQAYTQDPFHGLVITPHKSLDGLRPNLTGYEFESVFPQAHISSSALLLRGIVDFISNTPDGELIPIEVKTSARLSGKDKFQLTAYLNALHTGGIISRSNPINTQFAELSHKRQRLRKIMRTLRYEAAEELGKRLMRMAQRRNLEYQNVAHLEITNRINIRQLTEEVLSHSNVWSLALAAWNVVEPEHSKLRKALLQKFTITFTKRAMNSTTRGLLIYPRLEETQEIHSCRTLQRCCGSRTPSDWRDPRFEALLTSSRERAWVSGCQCVRASVVDCSCGFS